jgi:hypothetical protein
LGRRTGIYYPLLIVDPLDKLIVRLENGGNLNKGEVFSIHPYRGESMMVMIILFRVVL